MTTRTTCTDCGEVYAASSPQEAEAEVRICPDCVLWRQEVADINGRQCKKSWNARDADRKIQDLIHELKLEKVKHAWTVRQVLLEYMIEVPSTLWFALAVDALMDNERTHGDVYHRLVKTGRIGFNDLQGAIRAYFRHRKTNYNELLGSGLSVKEARERMREAREVALRVPLKDRV